MYFASAQGFLDNPVTLLELGADPGTVVNTGFLYTKDVAGLTELFYEDPDGPSFQITSGGGVALPASGAPSGASYLTLGLHASLTAERVLTAGSGITFTDTGADGTLTVANNVLTGLAGGQTWTGGTAASESLTIRSTSNATKGTITTDSQLLGITGSAALPTYSYTSFAAYGMVPAASLLQMSVNGTLVFAAAGIGATFDAQIRSDGAYTWSSGAIGAASDTFLYRDGAGKINLQSTTTACMFDIYNTISGANFEKVDIGWGSNVFTIQTSQSGTGVARAMQIGTAGAAAFTLLTTNVVRATCTSTGLWTFASGAVATGVNTDFTVTLAAHTNQTASTEVSGANFNMSATKQWATGALTTQREVLFQAPTYAFVGASTITTAATVAISGPPIAGTNATLSQTYSLWIQTGSQAFGAGPSNTGVVRLSNGNAINSRKSGGAADVSLLVLSAGDVVIVGNSASSSVQLGQGTSLLSFYAVTPVVRSAAYSVASPTTDRAFDAGADALAAVRNTLGTLILDLQLTGIIG